MNGFVQIRTPGNLLSIVNFLPKIKTAQSIMSVKYHTEVFLGESS